MTKFKFWPVVGSTDLVNNSNRLEKVTLIKRVYVPPVMIQTPLMVYVCQKLPAVRNSVLYYLMALKRQELKLSIRMPVEIRQRILSLLASFDDILKFYLLKNRIDLLNKFFNHCGLEFAQKIMLLLDKGDHFQIDHFLGLYGTNLKNEKKAMGIHRNAAALRGIERSLGKVDFDFFYGQSVLNALRNAILLRQGVFSQKKPLIITNSEFNALLLNIAEDAPYSDSFKIDVGDGEGFYKIIYFPYNVGQFDHLKAFELRFEVFPRLKVIPVQLFMLQSLRSLVLNLFHPLLENPEILNEVYKLKNLRHLDLSYSGITVFPEGICYAKRLKTLNLAGNKLKRIPDTISNLTCLTWLNLSHNYLSVLPKNIVFLTRLKRFFLCGNRLRDLPEGFSKLVALKLLNISLNQFLEIPDEVWKLNLKVFRCSNNLLTRISPKIANFKEIRTLQIDWHLIVDVSFYLLALLNKKIIDIGTWRDFLSELND